MKKRSFIFIFTILMFLCLINNVNAYWCKYGPDYGGKGDFSAKFKIDSDENPEVDYTEDTWFADKIENWDLSIDDSNLTGLLFRQAQKCPEYIIYDHASDSIFEINEDLIYISGIIDGKDYLKDTLKGVKKINSYRDGGPMVANLVSQPEIKQEPVIEYPSSCLDFTKSPTRNDEECDKTRPAACYSCENNPYFSCLWVEKNSSSGYCNVDELQYIKCGDSYDLPHEVPKLVSLAANLLKIAVPIVLIIIAIVTLVKALASSTEDEIKKAQKSLIKKLIVAVLIFFIVSIVQFVMLKVADDGEAGNLNDCLSCLLNNDCSESLYYKTTTAEGLNICTYLSSGNTFDCFDN